MLGRVDVARALLVAGADANSIDHNSFSPLYLASQNGHAQLVLDLLSAGADARIKTSRVSLFLLCLCGGTLESAKKLEKQGVGSHSQR